MNLSESTQVSMYDAMSAASVALAPVLAAFSNADGLGQVLDESEIDRAVQAMSELERAIQLADHELVQTIR